MVNTRPRRASRSRILGFLASCCGQTARRRPVTRQDLSHADYATSTQRLGVRFTERIRDVFRFRWIKF